MASDLDRHILVITEPTLKLDPMIYDSGKEEDPDGKKISKEKYLIKNILMRETN